MTKKIFIAGVLFLFFVAVSAGIVFALKKEKQEKAQQQEEQVQIQQQGKELQVVGQMEVERIDTSNWKTYRNEDYGFEVKYPGKWEISDNFVEGGNSVVLKNKDSIEIGKLDSIFISVYPSIRDYFYETADCSECADFPVLSQINFDKMGLGELLEIHPLISNVEKTDLVIESGSFSATDSSYGSSFTVFVESGELFFKIALDGVANEKELTGQHKLILGSFAFL